MATPLEDQLARLVERQREKIAHLEGGIDWKALSHAVRVNGESIELLSTGQVTFPRPEAQALIAIKTGKIQYDDVAHEIEMGLARVMELAEKSSLPEEPDRHLADDIILDVYGRQVLGLESCRR